MKNGSVYESRLRKGLQEGLLADLSRFHKRGLFDEVPLYSRYSDIAFLLDEGLAKANKVLLQFSLKCLESVVSYKQHEKPYFAAVTIWKPEEDDPITPNLFVWFDAELARPGKLMVAPNDKTGRFVERLVLHLPKTKLGREIKRLTAQLGLNEQFDVLEDTSTMPDGTRVFIGPSRRPYPSFMVLDCFRKTVSHAKQMN